MSDQYGLESNFKFAASSNSFSQMDRVIELLEGIEKATKETARSISNTSLGKDLMKSLNASGVKREGKELQGAVKQIANALSPLKSEFRALRAESRNIDFGGMTDTRQFKRASNEISRYIRKLKELEGQISGTTPADREFKASLRAQQRAAGDKVRLAKANRDAAMASERMSFSQAIGGAGGGVMAAFKDPLEAAAQLQQSLAGVKKLAGDISEAGERTLQNEVFNLSAKLGVEDTKISEIFEDLAGSGKKFGDEMGGIGSRIAEVEQILKNQQALDISSGAATQLDVTLGSIYKNLVSKDPNAIVELNARVASSINQLADKLSDVRISAEDVIPVMNVVMNTVGDAKNFPVDQIAAYSAAIASLGTIEPEAAGSFFNRMSAKMSQNASAFAGALNMTAEDFEKKLNADKLGVITDLAAAYKNVKGGELKQGSFFSSIGIGSVQDQKLLQGLANQLEVLKDASKVARGGFLGKEIVESIDPTTGKKVITLGENLKKLSVDEEIANVLRTSAFQAKRFDSSIKSLKDTLGSAVIEVITPLKSLASDAIGVFLYLTQIAPGLTKVLTASVFGLGALAAAAGTAGVALFGFQQAQAIATTAAIGMQHSLIPLTGFFQTSMNAFTGTFPWTNAFRQSTVVTEEFAVAAKGAKGLVGGELRVAFIALRSQVLLTSQAALGMARAFLMSPLGLAIGSFFLLDRLLQRANPQVRLLGMLFSTVSSAAGFAFGILEGFVGAFLNLLKVPVGAAGGLLASPFAAISEALEFAMESFRSWEKSGKHIGESIFNILAKPFIFAASATVGAWDKTIGFVAGLLKPLADLAAYIGHFIQGSLSEASPGPSFMTRKNWAFTAASMAVSFLLMQASSALTGEAIRRAMGASAAWVVTNWHSAIASIGGFFSGLTFPDALVSFATAVGDAWTGVFESIAGSWTDLAGIFSSGAPGLGGLAAAGMAAVQPLLAWGLPDIVSDGFDKITQPRSPAISPAPQPAPQPAVQISDRTQETQTIWEKLWERIGDLTQQGTSRVREAIATNLGTGTLDFLDRLGTISSETLQNAASAFDRFAVEGASGIQAIVGAGFALFEVLKGLGTLSGTFMGAEEKFFHSAIENFNLLGFSALVASSMLMNLVSVPFEALKKLPFFFGSIVSGFTSILGLNDEKLLEEGASKYASFLKVFERPGIGTALAKGLPGIVAVLMGLNVFGNLTESWTATLVGWSNRLPELMSGTVNAIFPAGEMRDLVNADLAEIGGMLATFWQNLAASADRVGDTIRPIFEAIASVKILTVPQSFADYMGFGEAIKPITDFIHSLPLLGMPVGELLIVEAAIGAIFDLLRSPTLSGIVGFLRGPLLDAVVAVGSVFLNLGRTVVTAFVGLPFSMVGVAIKKAAVSGGKAVKGSLIDPIKSFVVGQLQSIPGLISAGTDRLLGLLRRIPIVGDLVANAFESAIAGIKGLVGLAKEALPGYLSLMKTELNALGSSLRGLLPVFGALGANLVAGARYVIDQAIKPLMQAIGFFATGGINKLYIQTKGLQGVTKGVNPIDVGLSWMDDAIVGIQDKLGFFKGLEGDARANAMGSSRWIRNAMMGLYRGYQASAKELAPQVAAVSSGIGGAVGNAVRETFPIGILGSKLKAVRTAYLGAVAAMRVAKGYDRGFNLGPINEGFIFFKAVAPSVIQLLARAAFAWMTYYTILDAIKPALLDSVDAFARNHKELGIFAGVVFALTNAVRFLRLVFVDSVNAVGAFSVKFFQAFQVLAPIAGKAAGIIAFGIGLAVKGAMLGFQSLATAMLLPVVAVSKVMQGILIAIKYLTQQVAAEIWSIGRILYELRDSLFKGDVVGSFIAFGKLIPVLLQFAFGVGFWKLGRAVAAGSIALLGIVRRVARDGIALLAFEIIPYAVKKASEIGLAIARGISWGIRTGYRLLVEATLWVAGALDRALIEIGRNVARGMGILLETIEQMRIFGAASVSMFGLFVGALIFVGKQLGIIGAIVRTLIPLFSGPFSLAFLPWVGALSAVLFLLWQAQTGFKQLNAAIDALNHPVKWLQDSMANISKTFSSGIDTDWVAFFVEKLIRAVPIVLGGIFLLGFAVKKHIFGGFMLVWDVIKGIANSLIGAVRAAKQIPGAVMGIGTEGRILEGVHRTRSALGLYKDPQSKVAREDEFKLAKESVAFREKVMERSRTQIVTLAQKQKTDYGHLAREVEVVKGGFFGFGARKEKEWQLTAAGEEFHQKRLAETLQHKVGVFDDESMRRIASEVSPSRLGLMGGDLLRGIVGEARPDLTELGRALETVKVMNIAVANIDRLNGGQATEAKTAGAIHYSTQQLEGLGVQGLDKNRRTYTAGELTAEQLRAAVRGAGVSPDQIASASDIKKLTSAGKEYASNIMAHQLAGATGRTELPQTKMVASASTLMSALEATNRDKNAMTNSDPAALENSVRLKFETIRDAGYGALDGINFKNMMEDLGKSKNLENYKLKVEKYVAEMLRYQSRRINNAVSIDPRLLSEASAFGAQNRPDRISKGLTGILKDIVDGINQAANNAAKKLPGYREGLSLEAIRAIERKIAGAAPLSDPRLHDSRRSKLEAAQRQLRSGNLSAKAQQDVLNRIAELLQRDVYELTHPLTDPGKLNSQIQRAEAEREKLFRLKDNENKAYRQWLGRFNDAERSAVIEQLKQGKFKGGALRTKGDPTTVTENGVTVVRENYTDHSASLAQALGYETIEQVARAFSTEAILSGAKESWKTQLARVIGINSETKFYNQQIDATRRQIDQRISRQSEGFAQREARRNAVAAQRDAGFAAQLSQIGKSRADFMAQLDATQQEALNKFLQTGKFQTQMSGDTLKQMSKKMGFGDTDADIANFKKFRDAMGAEENKDMQAYLRHAMTSGEQFDTDMGLQNITAPDGQTMSKRARLIQMLQEAGQDPGNQAALLRRMRRSIESGQDRDEWKVLSEFMRTGQETTDLTEQQIAQIGRQMNLAGSDEQVSAQLRTIANQRHSGISSIGEAFKVFLKGIETDAGFVERYVEDRLAAMSSYSGFGRSLVVGLSDILRNTLFEPIVGAVKGIWKWFGDSVNKVNAGVGAMQRKGTALIASLPGIRTFVRAYQSREGDRQSSLQTLSAKMGYANQDKFVEAFREQLRVKGVTDSRTQDKALQSILNSRRSKGVAETLRTSRFQEVQDNSRQIGEALAATLGLNDSPQEIAKLLAPGGFTTRALSPLRNYFLKAVVPAVIDVGLAPLKSIYKIVRNPGLSLTTIKTKTGQIANAVADFMVASYTIVRRTFSYAATQLGKVPLFGKIWGAVSGFFSGIASKIQDMAAPNTTDRLRNLQNQRRVAARDSALASARAGEIEPERIARAAGERESSDTGTIGELNSRIARLAQARRQHVATTLNPFQRLLVFAATAARGAKNAWAQTAEEISQGGWSGLIARFKRVGYLLKRNISEGSPGPSADTRANWERTQESVGQNMDEMARDARDSGRQIQSEMQRTARRSASFLGALGGAVAGAGKAGMATGGAIAAIGFAAQTASYSLTNMGLLDEASATRLNKFLEIFTLIGAVGGLVAPVMGAIAAGVSAIGSAFVLIFNPVTLTLGAIAGGLLLANEGLKRFVGIDLLGPLAAKVREPIRGTISFIRGKIGEIFAWMEDKFGSQLAPILDPMVSATAAIRGAWQGFVDWFVAMPLVQAAIDIGMGLIDALNHNPTVQIPLAWEGAIEQIKTMLFGLPFVGDFIAGLLKDSLDPGKILDNLFQGFHSMLDGLEKSGLARFGGGKLLDGLRGIFGGAGKKQEVKTEIPVRAGVTLDYKDALEAAVRQADFDARSGTAGARTAAASLQYQLQATGGQMTGDQIGAAYLSPGGDFLKQAIAKQNNRLFSDRGGEAKKKRSALQDELQEIGRKNAQLQAVYAETIEGVRSASIAPASNNFFEGFLSGGSNNAGAFASRAAEASQAMAQLQEQQAAVRERLAAANFVFDAGTDRTLKSLGIDPDGLKVAVSEAKAAIASGIEEVGFAVSDRWRYLERIGGGNLGYLMATDLKKAGGAFHLLKGDVADFAKRASTSLAQMDWAGFKNAAKDFWGNLQFDLGQVASGFAGAGLSALLFYVHLSPLAFVLGAVALGGLAIATNFLGLRTVLAGLFRVFTGFARVAASSVMLVINVIRGLVKVAGGLSDALRGDFTKIGEGAEIVWTGIREGARGLLRGLGSIFGGGVEVLEGLFQGLKQAIGIVFGPSLIESAREAVAAIRQMFEAAGESIASALKKPGQVLDNIANRFRKGKEQIADSPIGRTAGAISDVAGGKAPNLDAARAARDFDMKMRGKGPEAELTAGDRARLAQSQMENVLSRGFDTSRHLGADTFRPTGSRGAIGEIDEELKRAEAGLGRMKDRSASAADAANDALSSLGIALSSFSPALAAPLFMVGDLLSGFTGLSVALPRLGALFPGVATAITGFSTALSAGTLTASGAIAGFGAVFTGTMAAIGSAASIAWAAVSGPLLPLFVAIGAVAVAFVAFRTNFLGFGDIVSGVFGGVGEVIGGIWQVVTSGISDIGSTIGAIGSYLIEPLSPLLSLFGIDAGGGGQQLQAAIALRAVNALLLPVRAIGLAVRGIVWSVFAVAKALLWLGGLVLRVVLVPVTLVSKAVSAIAGGFQALGTTVATVLLAPFRFLQGVVSWIWEKLAQLPGFLGQAIASVPLIGPLLQNLGNAIFQGGAQTPVQQFASGGAVVGPGSGTADRIPALLSNGEFVVSAGPARENLGMLTAINEGRGVEVMSMPVPTRIPASAIGSGAIGRGESPPAPPPVEININLQGDIVLGGATSAENAQEFLAKIEPYLQQAVWTMFRDWVDFNR